MIGSHFSGFFLFCAAYLAGSVNFSILLFHILKKDDPRNRFSGNPGATNVYRQAGLWWAIMILLLDMVRAFGIGAVAAYTLPYTWVPWIGLGLISGNRFPCFHSFRGGKGVANYLGFTLFLAPTAVITAALVWGGVYKIVRIPFISSFFMVYFLTAGIMTAYDFEPVASAGALSTAVFIYACHHQNIRELLA